MDLNRRGFFPLGGGNVSVVIPGLKKGEYLRPVTLVERGHVKRIRGICYSCIKHGQSTDVPLLMKHSVISAFTKLVSTQSSLTPLQKEITALLITPEPFDIETISINGVCDKTLGSGSGILLWAETDTGCVIASDALGDEVPKKDRRKINGNGKRFNKFKKKRESDGSESRRNPMEVVVEVVADKAVERLLKELEHGGCVDEYMQDQLIIFSALAKGKSIITTGPISLHTRCVHFLIMYQMSTMEIDNATSI